MEASKLPGMLEKYARDARVVLAHPFTYIERLGLQGPPLFRRGTRFALLSTAVGFLCLSPAFFIHDRGLERTAVFELTMLFGVVLFGVALHPCLKLLGGRGTVADTIGVIGFLTGITTPLRIILLYPSLLIWGPEVVLGGKHQQQLIDDLTVQDARFLAWNLLLASAVGLLWTVLTTPPNLARVHGFRVLGRTRALAAMVFVSVVASVLVLQAMKFAPANRNHEPDNDEDALERLIDES